MHAIDALAHDVLARLSTEWVVCVPTPDRHAREALRDEVRRLAREWGVEVRTGVYLDVNVGRDSEPLLVVVCRTDELPWDLPHDEAMRRLVDSLDE